MGAPKYNKQILTDLKGEIDKNIIKVGDFNTPTFNNGLIIQTENQYGNTGLKLYLFSSFGCTMRLVGS